MHVCEERLLVALTCLCQIFTNMDLFSLEEDDCHELFIMQNDKRNDADDGKMPIFPEGNDFGAPLVSLLYCRKLCQHQCMRILVMMKISKYQAPR